MTQIATQLGLIIPLAVQRGPEVVLDPTPRESTNAFRPSLVSRQPRPKAQSGRRIIPAEAVIDD